MGCFLCDTLSILLRAHDKGRGGVEADTGAALRRIEQKVDAMAVNTERLANDQERLLALFSELQIELKTANSNNTDAIVQASLDAMAAKIEAAIGNGSDGGTTAVDPGPAPAPATAADTTTTDQATA